MTDSGAVDSVGTVLGDALPEGWVRATVGELGVAVQSGFASGKHNRDGDGVIHLRPMNITRNGVIDTSDVRYVLDDSDRRVGYGDVLFNNTNSPALVGKTAWINSVESLAYSNHMTRLRPLEGLDGKFLAAQLHYLWSRGYFKRVLNNHVNQASVSRKALLETSIVVPPIGEQRRIVAKLDEQLAHIEAGDAAVDTGRKQVNTLRKAIICGAVPRDLPPGWEDSTVEAEGSVDLGRQRHPSWHDGPEMRPYLRVANVFEDFIDVSDVKEMDFSGTGGRYDLVVGDVLLNEGQSPHLLGRSSIYRGEPEGSAFQNTLLRFRAGSRVIPEWALLVFRRHMRSGRFMKESRITTNIAHLSAARLKKIEFPVPSISVQETIVKEVRQRLEEVDSLDAGLVEMQEQSGLLRGSLLHAAFTGTLVPQDSADEPASTLMAHIRAQREAAGKVTKSVPRKRAARVPRSRKPTASGQEELPL